MDHSRPSSYVVPPTMNTSTSFGFALAEVSQKKLHKDFSSYLEMQEKKDGKTVPSKPIQQVLPFWTE